MVQGYLFKRGEGMLGKLRWNRRWVVVSNKCLRYWETREATTREVARGAFNLTKVTSYHEATPPDSPPEFFYFTFLYNGREVAFYTEDASTYAEWVENIKKSVPPGAIVLSPVTMVEEENIFSSAITALSNFFGGSQDQFEDFKISAPSSMQHQAGIKKTADGFTCEFKNYKELPDDIKNLLAGAGFTQKEIEEDRQAIVQVLKFQQQQEGGKVGGGQGGARRAEVMVKAGKGKGSPSSSSSSSSSEGTPVPSTLSPGQGPPRPKRSTPSPTPSSSSSTPISPFDSPVPVGGEGRTEGGPLLPEKDSSLKLEDIVSKENPGKIYRNMKQIGEGASGKVFVAEHAVTKEKVAIKQMILSRQPKPEVLVNEVLLMKKCNDETIVSFKDSFLMGGVLWVVMELIEGEDLTNVLQVHMEEPQMALIVREVLRALAHMHSMGVIHRDIKSDNVMVSLENGSVKLTDFGFGAQVTHARNQRNTMVGTSYWMAPEVIKSENYDYKCDIWSLGVMTRELIEKDPPYFTYPPMKALFMIIKHGLPDLPNPHLLSPEMIHFIQLCTARDPCERPTAEELLEHPWILGAGKYEDLIPIVKESRESGGGDY